MNAHFTNIVRVIQLAVAPVFLLSAIGTLLSVFSGRLGRIVDRARVIVDGFGDSPGRRHDDAMRDELAVLRKRRRLIDLAITWGVVSAILVCLVIGTAFVGYLVKVDLAITLAVLFIAATLGFAVSLLVFLREILVSVRGVFMDLPD